MSPHKHKHHLAELPVDLAEDAAKHHRKKHKRRRCVRRALAFVAFTDVALKAVALHAALRNDDKHWVMPLALINSAGILPIYYLVTKSTK